MVLKVLRVLKFLECVYSRIRHFDRSYLCKVTP